MRYLVKLIPEDKILSDEGEIFILYNRVEDVKAYLNKNGEKINVTGEFPPVPLNVFDYAATLDSYDGADDSKTRNQIGYGKTEKEAIVDLVEQIEN